MTAPIDIVPATEEDFPTLAQIHVLAHGVDLLDRLMFETSPFDTTLQTQFAMAELRRAASNPRSHTFKAVLQGTAEIVGYGRFRFDDGQDESGPSMGSFPPGTNVAFVRRLAQGFKERHSKHMGGKPHAFWSTLMVHPAYQRRGIGSALLQHGFHTLGADTVPIWLITQMRGRNLYAKFGFEDVDVLDVDFAEWMGPLRGYGVHRSVCMVRWPGGGGLGGASEKTRLEPDHSGS